MKNLLNHIQSGYIAKAGQLETLQRIVIASLPKSCHFHVHVADIRDGQLILITDSPVWATKIRLYFPSILDMLREHAQLSLTGVRIRQSFTPLPKPPELKTIKRRPLSKNTLNMLNSLADDVEDDRLANAIRRLTTNRD